MQYIGMYQANTIKPDGTVHYPLLSDALARLSALKEADLPSSRLHRWAGFLLPLNSQGTDEFWAGLPLLEVAGFRTRGVLFGQPDQAVRAKRETEFDRIFGKGAYFSEVAHVPLTHKSPDYGKISVRAAFSWIGPKMTGEFPTIGERLTRHIPSIELGLATMALWYEHSLRE